MDESTSRNVELYVRSLAPCETRNEQDAIVERLQDLEQRGVVDDVDLTVWGNAVCLDGATAQVGTGSQVAERIREFYRWCEDEHASLEPYFTTSVVDSETYGDTFRRVVPPHRCLAVYEDDQLRAVYPSSVEGTDRSLADGLASLEADDTVRHQNAFAIEEA